MRWVCWMMVVGSAWLLAGPAAAQEAGCGCAASSPYGMPACAAPCYGSAAGMSGCDCSGGCCQNVWDGYQEEQARMRAYWARVEGHCNAKVAANQARRGCGRPHCTSCNACAAPACESGCGSGCQTGVAAATATPAPLTPAVGRTMGFRPPVQPKY